MIPPDASAAFVATMEDVLEVYQRPQDPPRPLVCLDETSKQLIVETRAPIPAKPGRKARHDYEYEIFPWNHRRLAAFALMAQKVGPYGEGHSA